MTAPSPRIPGGKARFTTGSIPRHILSSTGAAAVGLMAIFLGELANVLFLSWLGDVDVLAALGYASTALFLLFSTSIGASITAGALVAPAIGAGDLPRARRLATNVLIVTIVLVAAASALMWVSAPSLLAALGAKGRAHELALEYMRIMVPFMPTLAIGMSGAALLRAEGDVRRAMNVTLVGAAVNVALDPLLIFTFGLGMAGAAWATSIARLAVGGIGLYYLIGIHHLLARPSLQSLSDDARAIVRFAVPAILTNLATPVGGAYVTYALAAHGNTAVAAWALIGRLTPVAFGAIFALSGAVGPVIGQNLGARQLERVREALDASLVAAVAFTALAWLVLAILADPIITLFNASGDTARLLTIYFRFLSPMFAFLGILFVANAALNALGRPHLPTFINWGRATLGTVPFVMAGSALFGPAGVMAANLFGASIFGLLAAGIARRIITGMIADAPHSAAPNS